MFTADLSDRESIESLVERVLAEHPVDVLVNNAGRSIRRSAMLAEHRFHDYERTMALNYFGAARLSMALMAHMRERGGGGGQPHRRAGLVDRHRRAGVRHVPGMFLEIRGSGQAEPHPHRAPRQTRRR